MFISTRTTAERKVEAALRQLRLAAPRETDSYLLARAELTRIDESASGTDFTRIRKAIDAIETWLLSNGAAPRLQVAEAISTLGWSPEHTREQAKWLIVHAMDYHSGSKPSIKKTPHRLLRRGDQIELVRT